MTDKQPAKLGEYTLFSEINNTCAIAGKPLIGGGYALSISKAHSGAVFSREALIQAGRIDDLAQTGLDQKLVESLAKVGVKTYTQVKAMGKVGLVGIDGIGSKSADDILGHFKLEAKNV